MKKINKCKSKLFNPMGPVQASVNFLNVIRVDNKFELNQ